MKYTKENIIELLTHFRELNELAMEYVNDGYDHKKYNWTDARVNYNCYTIDHKINTACNCHPEYEWQDHSSIDKFVEWLDKKQKF